MKYIQYPGLVMALLLLFSCKTYTPDQLPDAQIRFGDGGGFAGIETTYTLLENGQLFKSSSLDSLLSELPKAKSKQAKTLFQQLEVMEFDSLNINAPGNIYRFIVKKDAVSTHTVVWEGNTQFPQLDTLYQQLTDLIKVD